jgi:NitT/TauT family transport system ATP-binding protein
MIQFIKTELPTLIEMRGIVQQYKGKKVLDGLDFLIEDKPEVGELRVIMGASGCGKSTLLRYITGLQTPTSGTIEIRGKPRTNEAVSMVFQDYSSFPWRTVLGNVEFPLEVQGMKKSSRREVAMDMIEKVGLLGHENKYAQAPTLSGGQLQRVAIARSMVANPSILLMDEPFAALDPHTRQSMQDMLLKLLKEYKSTIIFVTHDASEAVYLGDIVYVLDSRIGKISHKVDINLGESRDISTKDLPEFFALTKDVNKAILETCK